MKVTYLLTKSELVILSEILGFSYKDDLVDKDDLLDKEWNIQSLINKGFLKYKDKKVIVEPSVRYILHELSQAKCVRNKENKKMYQCNHLVIVMEFDKNNIRLNVYETLTKALAEIKS